MLSSEVLFQYFLFVSVSGGGERKKERKKEERERRKKKKNADNFSDYIKPNIFS
jgi:hypothetical protein